MRVLLQGRLTFASSNVLFHAIRYLKRNKILNNRLQLIYAGQPFTGDKRDVWVRNRTIIFPLHYYDATILPLLKQVNFDGWYWEIDNNNIISLVINNLLINFDYISWRNSQFKIAIPTLAINLYLFLTNKCDDDARNEHLRHRMVKFFKDLYIYKNLPKEIIRLFARQPKKRKKVRRTSR